MILRETRGGARYLQILIDALRRAIFLHNTGPYTLEYLLIRNYFGVLRRCILSRRLVLGDLLHIVLFFALITSQKIQDGTLYRIAQPALLPAEFFLWIMPPYTSFVLRQILRTIQEPFSDGRFGKHFMEMLRVDASKADKNMRSNTEFFQEGQTLLLVRAFEDEPDHVSNDMRRMRP